MAIIQNFKAIFRRKDKKMSIHVPSDVTSEKAQPLERKDSTVHITAVAVPVTGVEAESYHLRVLLEAVHHKSVVSIRPPISRGALAEWFEHLTNKGVSPAALNALIGIDCSSGDITQTLKAIEVSKYEAKYSAPTIQSPSTPDAELTPVSRSDTLCVEVPLPPVAGLPTLSQFDLLKRLGAGAFGTVILAKHKPSGTCVALKAIPKVPQSKRLPQDCDTQFLEARARTREGDETLAAMEVTLAEFFALHRTRGEKTILQILAAFHDLRYYYIATTFHPRGDLETLLKKSGPLTMDRVQFYTADLVLGLEALRKHGVVHRDIKPANILIGNDGHLVFADLGLARCFSRDTSDVEARFFSPEELEAERQRCTETTRRTCGTPTYFSPEVVRGEPYSYATDVWSVGVVVFVMMFGRLPWVSDSVSSLLELIRREPVVVTELDRVRVNVSAQAEDLVLSILDKNQYTRPTPTQLQTHEFFSWFDWENHAQCEAPAWWTPNIHEEPSLSANDTLIKGTRILEPHEDPFPCFAFLSPSLVPYPPAPSPIPTPTTALPDPEESSLDTMSSSGSLVGFDEISLGSYCDDTSTSMSSVSPGPSELACLRSPTLVGSPVVLLSPCLAAPSPNVSPCKVTLLTRIKKWARSVWRCVRLRTFGT